MTKTVHDDVLDGALNIIRLNANFMTACSQAPTTSAEALVTYALSDAAMTSGDFTIGNGDTNGRKAAVAAQAGEAIETGGSANHVALVESGTSRLLYVTEATTQALTSGNTLDYSTWDIEIADPT
ncbi:MAG: hypothetical protein ACW99U_18270 [Candidatus Thorarchaeota archaeon]|jgi:hypothetical protein